MNRTFLCYIACNHTNRINVTNPEHNHKFNLFASAHTNIELLMVRLIGFEWILI